jgi:hypothetical protein
MHFFASRTTSRASTSPRPAETAPSLYLQPRGPSYWLVRADDRSGEFSAVVAMLTEAQSSSQERLWRILERFEAAPVAARRALDDQLFTAEQSLVVWSAIDGSSLVTNRPGVAVLGAGYQLHLSPGPARLLPFRPHVA